jgi:hypothetical protein
MAVTIDEVEVDVRDTPPPQGDASGRGGPARPKTDLAEALARLRERRERLKAD